MAHLRESQAKESAIQRLLQAVGNDEKGIVLLEHLKKKDEKEILKMKKKFEEVLGQ